MTWRTLSARAAVRACVPAFLGGQLGGSGVGPPPLPPSPPSLPPPLTLPSPPLLCRRADETGIDAMFRSHLASQKFGADLQAQARAGVVQQRGAEWGCCRGVLRGFSERASALAHPLHPATPPLCAQAMAGAKRAGRSGDADLPAREPLYERRARMDSVRAKQVGMGASCRLSAGRLARRPCPGVAGSARLPSFSSSPTCDPLAHPSSPPPNDPRRRSGWAATMRVQRRWAAASARVARRTSFTPAPKLPQRARSSVVVSSTSTQTRCPRPPSPPPPRRAASRGVRACMPACQPAHACWGDAALACPTRPRPPTPLLLLLLLLSSSPMQTSRRTEASPPTGARTSRTPARSTGARRAWAFACATTGGGWRRRHIHLAMGAPRPCNALSPAYRRAPPPPWAYLQAGVCQGHQGSQGAGAGGAHLGRQLWRRGHGHQGARLQVCALLSRARALFCPRARNAWFALLGSPLCFCACSAVLQPALGTHTCYQSAALFHAGTHLRTNAAASATPPLSSADTLAVATRTPCARACASNVNGSPATPSCSLPPPLCCLLPASASAPRVVRIWRAGQAGSGVREGPDSVPHRRRPSPRMVRCPGPSRRTHTHTHMHACTHLVDLSLQPLADKVHGVCLGPHVRLVARQQHGQAAARDRGVHQHLEELPAGG